ncbi:MAG TPA: NADH dehydrogenase (quinone) subunit D [Gaiellaceae bacterium]|nr:NADH dehydrogenase (quinone) subunit D [Gaiellaceae bacterium]
MATIADKTEIYKGSRIPQRVPTILDVPAELRDNEDVMQVNFGPNHPSTHGVLRLIVDLHGEQVVGTEAVIGYLHTGFEKTMESKTYWKCVTYPERIDYVGYQNNELVFVSAVEQLLELEVPTKAKWMRMLLCELNRIHSHLVYLGTSALELGAISMFWYCFRERETILDLFEMVCGARMHTRYFQAGGLAEDIPAGFFPECRKFVDWMPQALDDYLAVLDRNQIWLERTKGVGLLSAEDAIALGQSGPVLRASGVDWDLRRDSPYLAYDQVDFRVPVYTRGDVYDRYRVRMDEMAESTKIVRQCLDRLERMEGQPWIADDRKVVLPPREELQTSMESLIHHFKIVTEGYRVPEGEVYVAIESPRGESGVYVVSDGGPKPWRVHFRAPSFAALQATATCTHDALIADLIAIVGSLDAVMGDTDR